MIPISNTSCERYNLNPTARHIFCLYPVTFLRHDDEELPQPDAQLVHVFGVSAAALSQSLHQRDVRPHFVHHAAVLTEGAAISVRLCDLQPLRVKVKNTTEEEEEGVGNVSAAVISQNRVKEKNNRYRKDFSYELHYSY